MNFTFFVNINLTQFIVKCLKNEGVGWQNVGPVTKVILKVFYFFFFKKILFKSVFKKIRVQITGVVKRESFYPVEKFLRV